MKIRLTILFGSIFSLSTFAQKDQQIIAEGNKLYKQKQFDKAAEEYLKVTDKSNENVNAQYNLGNAFYRSNKVEAAEKVFDGVAENSNAKPIKTNAFYNKGVTLSNQKKLEESIEAYKQALRLTPTDIEARENLQKALNELKKDQQQKPDPKDDKKKNNDKKDPKEEPEKNKSSLNKKQAEQMLNALRQEEKAIQKDLQKSKNKGGGVPEKDW